MNVRKRDIISTVKDQFISDKGASGHPALVLETQEEPIISIANLTIISTSFTLSILSLN